MSPRAQPSALPRRFVASLVGLMFFALVPQLASAAGTSVAEDEFSARRIVVAIDEKPDPMLANASSPRGYAGLPGYSGSLRTRSAAQRLAREFALTEVAAWVIEPLRVRCMLYEVPAHSDRAELLDLLRRDPRVALAQPLQTFTTLTAPTPRSAALATAQEARFNDPYVGLQTGFQSIAAGPAQRWSSGEDVSVALIDTGVDAHHPDLVGRVAEQRDFVGIGDPARDRHGTEVAGIIAAVANNRLGIVGIAPSVELHSYRACWPLADDAGRAQCNSFTLALALAEAIRAQAQIINLSLGGPHDPLLDRLLAHAIAQGAIVIGAVAADADAQGFPIGTRGVIAVDSSGAERARPHASALHAPGIEILTLEPGGSYDYASGSSLATAHVTGAVALLLQIAPRLDEAALVAMLRESVHRQGGPIDVCVAIRAATGQPADCGDDARADGTPHALR